MTLKRYRFYQRSRALVGIFIFAALMLLLFYSSTVIAVSIDALDLCAKSIVPSLFVYMIASDILTTYGEFTFIENSVGILFEKLFGMSRACVVPFLIGSVCGFPIGGKMVCDLFSSGRISKNDAEYAIGVCNNTGPAFVIAGVGVSMFGSFDLGVRLYSAQIISAVITGLIFGFLRAPFCDRPLPNRAFESKMQEKKSLISSISSAATRLMFVCGCVVFFSVLSGVAREIIGSSALGILLSSFLEIGSAVKYLSSLAGLPKGLLLPLVAATISFSGISVYMQTKIFSDKAGVSMRIYLFEKLLCAAMSFVIFKILFL